MYVVDSAFLSVGWRNQIDNEIGNLETTQVMAAHLFDCDDDDIDVRYLIGRLEVAAFPLGDRGLVEHVERQLVAQVLYKLDPER